LSITEELQGNRAVSTRLYTVLILLFVTASTGEAQDLPPDEEEIPFPPAVVSICAADIRLVRDVNGEVVKIRVSSVCSREPDTGEAQFLEDVKNRLKASTPCQPRDRR
jgi:hypothetical protein